jgi:hypothetical protein
MYKSDLCWADMSTFLSCVEDLHLLLQVFLLRTGEVGSNELHVRTAARLFGSPRVQSFVSRTLKMNRSLGIHLKKIKGKHKKLKLATLQ